jgi:hypothetical protein
MALSFKSLQMRLLKVDELVQGASSFIVDE